MLDSVTTDTFETHKGSTFRMHIDEDQVLDLELVEVTSRGEAGSPDAGRGQAFALIFRGPREAALPQRIYRLEHEKLGTLEIFLVPIGPDDTGMRFEAVFN